MAGFSFAFDTAYSSASPVAALVPQIWDVSLAGRVFQIDTLMGAQDKSTWNHQSIQYLTKFLTSPVFGSPTSVGEVGETSLNPDINWRRSAGQWNHGAGQIHLDLKTSDRDMFRASKGIDPWTSAEISLLPDTASKRSSANTNLFLETTGTRLWLADGSALKHTTDLATWSDSGVSTTVAGITSGGNTLWVALPAGVFTITDSDSAVGGSSYNNLVPDVIAYRKGRLMASAGAAVYNITTGRLSGPPTGLTVTALASAQRSHAYNVGDYVIPATPNSHYYKCTTAGTSGSGVPSWNTGSGSTTADGTVTWTEQGATATYGYRVSALNSAGETLACSEVTATGAATLSATVPVTLTWSAVTGATSYKVYGRTSGGELFMSAVSGVTFTDDGTATPAGALPAADTTAAAPAALYTHDDANWRWVGFASGDTCIYAAGYSGDYSAVYRFPIKSDGTGLDVPVQAGELPKGETALTIGSYLGVVFIGTTVGLRMATQGSSGELTILSALPVGPVRCLSGDGRFVWFGWENIDATSTGLGRLDLTVINIDAPAYASDLQAAAQGEVPAVVTFGGKRVFTVAGAGVYQETSDLVSSGWVDSGLITFDLPDPKVAQAITVLHSNPVVGSFAVSLTVDQGGMNLLGTHDATTADQAFTCSSVKGSIFEVRLTLNRDSTDTTTGPTVTRFTLMALPAALSGEQIMVPLKLTTRPQPPKGSPVMRDVGDDLAFLTNLRKTKQQFVYQEAGVNYYCTMQDYVFYPTQITKDRQAFEGTFIAQLLHQDVGA